MTAAHFAARDASAGAPTEVLPPLPAATAPPGRRSLSPFPLMPVRAEAAGEQAARLLDHIAEQVTAGMLVDQVWPALAAGHAPRRPEDRSGPVEPYARWLASRWLAWISRGYALRDGWHHSMMISTALPGDWVDGLVCRCDPLIVVEALSTAARALRGQHAQSQ